MIAVAVAPSMVASASTGAAWLATGQLATMNTIEPSSQLVMLISDRYVGIRSARNRACSEAVGSSSSVSSASRRCQRNTGTRSRMLRKAPTVNETSR